MRTRTALVLAIVVALLLVVAAPVSADKSVRGWMELELNSEGFGNPDTPCPHIGWAGTIDIDGVLYGISFDPIAPLMAIGDTLFFHELWRIHDVNDIEITDGLVTKCEGPGLIWGYERGDVPPYNATKAEGYVVWVDARGPFDPSLLGSATNWNGTYSNNGTAFAGPFIIK